MRRAFGGLFLMELLVMGLLLLGAGSAWANDVDPLSVQENAYGVAGPEYDVTANHISIAIFSRQNPGVTTTTALANGRIFFYDTDCNRKFDRIFKPTPNGVVIVNINTLVGVPPQGAIVAGTSVDGLNLSGGFPAGTHITLQTLQVDLAKNFAGLEDGARSNATGGWAPYDNEAFIPIIPADNGTTSTTNIHFSCPIKDLGTDLNLIDGGSPFPTGTTAQALEMLVFDTNESPIGSVHGFTCKCFTLTRPSTLFGLAATTDTMWQIVHQLTTGNPATDESFTLTYDTQFTAGPINVRWNTRPFRNPEVFFAN